MTDLGSLQVVFVFMQTQHLGLCYHRQNALPGGAKPLLILRTAQKTISLGTAAPKAEYESVLGPKNLFESHCSGKQTRA